MMAHPFLPMTTELLKKMTRVDRESISAAEFCEQRFVFKILNVIPAEELNSQISETNQSHLHTNNRL